MHKKLRITVEGKAYEVLVEDISSTEDTYSAMSAAMTTPITPVVAAPAAAAPAPSAPVSVSPGDEVSPLSGVVESVIVSVGQAVTAGDKVMVIEAMKMKTPVHANHSGTVKSISVKPGDAVEAGGVLMSIG